MNVIHVYKDGAFRWRWRVVSSNGKTVSASGESFYSKWNAKRAARRAHPELTLKETK